MDAPHSPESVASGAGPPVVNPRNFDLIQLARVTCRCRRPVMMLVSQFRYGCNLICEDCLGTFMLKFFNDQPPPNPIAHHPGRAETKVLICGPCQCGRLHLIGISEDNIRFASTCLICNTVFEGLSGLTDLEATQLSMSIIDTCVFKCFCGREHPIKLSTRDIIVDCECLRCNVMFKFTSMGPPRTPALPMPPLS